MFNNLIESSSHTREIKRRGSFVLFTAVTYCLLFVIGGVMSIYAYEATLEDPNTEIVIMLPPVEPVAPQPPSTVRNSAPPRGNNSTQNLTIRQNPIATVNVPQAVPKTISANPSTAATVPDIGLWARGPQNSDPGSAVAPGSGNTNGSGTTPARAVVIEVEPPLPEPIPKAVPRVISKGVITSQALSLPKPVYSSIARQAGVQGAVSVQVLIDETGKVISAKTVSGNPLLAGAAQQAAFRARFSPTRLGDQAVKVSGVITYNFVLQ